MGQFIKKFYSKDVELCLESSTIYISNFVEFLYIFICLEDIQKNNLVFEGFITLYHRNESSNDKNVCTKIFLDSDKESFPSFPSLGYVTPCTFFHIVICIRIANLLAYDYPANKEIINYNQPHERNQILRLSRRGDGQAREIGEIYGFCISQSGSAEKIIVH